MRVLKLGLVIGAVVALIALAYAVFGEEDTSARRPAQHIAFVPAVSGLPWGEAERQRTADILRARLVDWGLDAARVTVANEAVWVEIAGEEDAAALIPYLSRRGSLELVDFSGLPSPPAEGTYILTDRTLPALITPDWQLNPVTGAAYATVIDGTALTDARAFQDQNVSEWRVAFELSADGSAVFEAFTAAHIGQPVGIVLDNMVLSAPVIIAPIAGNGVIADDFSRDEAETLARHLRSGALPVPLQALGPFPEIQPAPVVNRWRSG